MALQVKHPQPVQTLGIQLADLARHDRVEHAPSCAERSLVVEPAREVNGNTFVPVGPIVVEPRTVAEVDHRYCPSNEIICETVLASAASATP